MERSSKGFFRDFVVCLSLTNLCFLKVWARLLERREWYFDPGWRNDQLLALVMLTTGLALSFAGTAWLVRRSGNRMLQSLMAWLFLAAVVVTFVHAGTQLFWRVWRVWVVVAFAVCVVSPIAYLRWREKIKSALITALLIVSPFVVFLLAQSAFWFVRGSGSFEDKPATQVMSRDKHQPLVVWIIFDELDEKFAFERRPPGVSLPEFDRFRRESLVASNAQPPADGTFLSIPALLSGEPVSAARPEGADNLQLKLAKTGEWVSWGAQPNIFSRAKAMGINSAIVGWYHPYCRVIADSVSSCAWTGGAYESLAKSEPYTYLGKVALGQVLEVFGTREWMASNEIRGAIKQHAFLEEQAKRALTDPAYGLVFLHFSVPHPPGVYDRRTQAWATDRGSYYDNLALADRTLGDLRSVMEREGTWERATVLVTSDHWFRVPLWRTNVNWSDEDEALFEDSAVAKRVPFMLRFPGEHKYFGYEKPFNTVITADLLSAIFQGQVTSSESAAQWIDHAASKVDRTIYVDKYGMTPVVFRLPDLLP